jgi:hypothetical protein
MMSDDKAAMGDKTALVMAKRAELVALVPKHGDSELIPEQTWIYDWKDGKCERIRLKINGVFVDPVEWTAAEVAKAKER